jgi:hypothetical protein
MDAQGKAEHCPISRELQKLLIGTFFWPFKRLILIFSAIFWYCMITRQLIVQKMSINYARNNKKKSSDEQFLKASRNWEKCLALDPNVIFNA